MDGLKIANFRYGLDKRRTELTSTVGTLENVINGHVNSGGEIEGRKAFILTSLPANTFGAEATDTGIKTFGSNADPGGWPIGNVAAYQRLQHPAVLDGAVYDGAKHAMTGVVFSCPFLGKAFVAATYADGFVFLYWNGTLIEQSRRGVALSAWTSNSNLAGQLEDTLTGIDGFHALATGASVDIWSDFGIDYVPSVDELVSAAGTITMIKVSDSTAGTPGVAAVGSFAVNAFSTTGSITTISVGGVTINADAIPCTGLASTTAVAAAIVAEINESVSTPKYTAENVANVVFIRDADSQGATANTKAVVVTTTKVCIGLAGAALPTAAADGDTCTSIRVDPTGANTEILGATITKAGTVTSWAAAIAAQIVTFNTAYTAASSGEVVFVSKKVTSSADANLVVRFTLSAGSVIGNPPASPTNIVITPATAIIQLDWDAVTGAVTYTIYRSTSLHGTYFALISVADPTVTAQDTVLALDTRYFYRLTATNEVGESPMSHIVSGIASALNIGANSLEAHDAAIEYHGASAGVLLERGNTPGTLTPFAFFAAADYNDASVSLAVPYYYQLGDHGNLPIGAELNGTTPTAPFNVALSRLSLIGSSGSASNNVLVTTEQFVVAIVSGGTGGNTFAWVEEDNPNDIFPTDPDDNQTKFRANVTKGQSIFATFKCLVTDSSGAQEYSGLVQIALHHT